MKKIVSLALCLALLLCLCGSALAIGDCGATDGRTCNLYYRHISGGRTHQLWCSVHDQAASDEEKPCELDGEGECIYCHCDYEPDEPDDNPFMDASSMEAFMKALNKTTKPLTASVSGAKATLAFSDEMKANLSAEGLALDQKLLESCELELKVASSSYSYTGEPVKADVALHESNPELIDFLEEYVDLFVGGFSYKDNVLPGTATVTTNFSRGESFYYKLSATFTITKGGAAAEYCYAGSASDPCRIEWLTDAQEKTHTKICTAHEDLGSPYDYVVMSYAYDCLLDDSGVCSVCEHSYAADLDAIYKTVLQEALEKNEQIAWIGRGSHTMEGADAKVYASFVKKLKEKGYALNGDEENVVALTLTLSGTTFPYNGSLVEPEAEVVMTGKNSLISRMMEDGFITVGDILFFENNHPGEASATVDLSMDGEVRRTLMAHFTIEAEDEGGSGNQEFFDRTLTSEEGVSLFGGMTEDAELLIDLLGKDTCRKILAKAGKEDLFVVRAYDVNVRRGEYTGMLRLSLPISEAYIGKELIVLHDTETGVDVQHAMGEEKDGRAFVTVNVDHFSPFLVLSADGLPGNPGGNVPGEPEAAVPDTTDMPATGDSSHIALWLALLAIACIGFSLGGRRFTRG